MKTSIATLKTLNWEYITALMLILIMLGSLATIVLTRDLPLAQTASGLAAGPKPMGYSWGG